MFFLRHHAAVAAIAAVAGLVIEAFINEAFLFRLGMVVGFRPAEHEDVFDGEFFFREDDSMSLPSVGTRGKLHSRRKVRVVSTRRLEQEQELVRFRMRDGYRYAGLRNSFSKKKL